MSRWHSVNVLQVNPALSQLWRFNAEGDRFAFSAEQSLLPSESCPTVVAKDWTTLFRRKFNVAWLPADKVFLRTVHLPTSDPAEIASMVELQLEKLSPLPVAQICWSLEILPKPVDKPDALQTVVVVVVARNQVDEYLGVLERKGYLADRLEVPSLDQLLATEIKGEGVWIYLGPEGEPALVAWWYGGALQNLALISLSVGSDRESILKKQLEHMAWAGELEGWLNESPRLHLVAAPEQVASWEAIMRGWTDQPLQIISPPAPKDLAARGAERAARIESRSSLLPPDSAALYQQRFVDGLWMKGLFTLLVIYAMGVVMYLTALSVVKMQLEKQQKYVAELSGSYTNALQNRARIEILKDRQELKYAALDCWKAVAETVPDAVSIEHISFQRGTFDLQGTVPIDQQIAVTTFNKALRQASVHTNEVLFSNVGPPTITAQGQVASWRFSCTLKGGDK